MDLSAFKDGLEVIVPNPIKILVPSTGYPRPTATWSFGDKVLEAGDRVKMKTAQSLQKSKNMTGLSKMNFCGFTVTILDLYKNQQE